MEVNDDYELIITAGLEESMFDVGERDIYVMTLLRHKADSILMNLQGSDSLLTDYIWTDNQIFKDFLFTLNEL